MSLPPAVVRGSSALRVFYFAPAIVLFLIPVLWAGGLVGTLAGSTALAVAALRAWGIGIERRGQTIIVRNFWRTISLPAEAIISVEVVRISGLVGMIRIPHEVLEIRSARPESVRIAASTGGSLFGRRQLESCRILLASAP